MEEMSGRSQYPEDDIFSHTKGISYECEWRESGFSTVLKDTIIDNIYILPAPAGLIWPSYLTDKFL